MKTCDISSQTQGVNFEDLMEAMQKDLYWIRFFVRPCCPAPDFVDACAMLDRLKGEVEVREDLAANQRQQLCAVIEARKEWYPTSGLCRTNRQ